MTEAIATPASCKRRGQSRSWAAASPGSPPLKNWQSAASTSRCTSCAQMSAAALTTTREASVPLSSSAGSPPPSTPRSAPYTGSLAQLRPLPDRRGHPRDPGRAVAGEHGFRFFPAYYIHIWDLFQRIPVYERIDLGHGEIAGRTSRTIMDNVRRVVTQGTTVEGKPSLVFPREAPRSLAEFLTTTRQLTQLGFTPLDIQTFVSRLPRLPRHQSRAPCKRAAESVGVRLLRRARCTGKSRPVQLLGPLQLRSARNAASSRRIRHALWRCPHKCVDLSAAPVADGPPRHQGRRGAQRPDLRTLVRPLVPPPPRVGSPFRPRRWSLSNLPAIDPKQPPHLRPRVQVKLADGARLAPDYTVVAVDAPAAERITASLRAAGTGGTVHRLDGFTTVPPPDDPLQPRAEIPTRWTRWGGKAWDRFQTLGGIQYYFDTEFQLLRGHMYYSGTEWALSSINQHGLWEKRPIWTATARLRPLSGHRRFQHSL